MDDPQARLEQERREAVRSVAELRATFAAVVAASSDSNADDEHDPEGHTIAFERAQVVALIEQAERHLGEVEAAQERVQAGTWGTCERCGEPIAQGRLEARPVARTCVTCAALDTPAR